MRKFLKDKVINGGAIPASRAVFVNTIWEGKRGAETASCRKTCCCDFWWNPRYRGEMCAEYSPGATRILAYLADIFLEKCNHSTVSMVVVNCLQDYSIANQHVIVFDTDHAAYMKKTFVAALQSLFPNPRQITCMAHITNLISSAFCKPFHQLNGFMLSWSQMFNQTGSCKRQPAGKKATMAPNLGRTC